MTWNYRVVAKLRHGITTYAIHEVYYGEDGKPSNVTRRAVDVGADDIGDLRLELQLLSQALDRPVLDYDRDFPR